MSRLKIPRPSKWVLVKYRGLNETFVLERREWELYTAAGKAARHLTSEAIAESNDRDELKMFQKLTEEG